MQGTGPRAEVLAVGDVFANANDGARSFRHLGPLLGSGPVVFGNCEGVYADDAALSPARRHYMGASRRRGGFYGEVPFHVMTCANNHFLDGGYAGMRETLSLLRDQGIGTTGAGENLAEALAPAIVVRDGASVAFLGFCSVFPVGHEARADRPGLAPLRVHTHYEEPDRSFWEPAIAPSISTQPDRGDLERFEAAIGAAGERADYVVVACHWGYSSRLELLDDYEIELARHAVESGADAVVCHHHHSLRGVELHRGQPIFYGLGSLIHHFEGGQLLSETELEARRARFGTLSSAPDDNAFPRFPFHSDARQTGVALIKLGGDGVEAGLIPARMQPDGSTAPLPADDPDGRAIGEYVIRLSEQSGFDTRFEHGSWGDWALLRVLPGGPG